jgi:hypothetical protein
MTLNSARNTFGSPTGTYSYRQYTVLVWAGICGGGCDDRGANVGVLLSGGNGT